MGLKLLTRAYQGNSFPEAHRAAVRRCAYSGMPSAHHRCSGDCCRHITGCDDGAYLSKELHNRHDLRISPPAVYGVLRLHASQLGAAPALGDAGGTAGGHSPALRIPGQKQ